MTKLREISLFSGAGGGVLGTHLHGVESVAYVEWAEFPQRILKARIADGNLPEGPVHGDVQEFDGNPWKGKADIVSAGFPCQPFSLAGNQLADKDPRNMWPATIRILKEVRPKYGFMENVGGLLTQTHGYFKVVTGDLNESGLPLIWDVIPTAAAGGPHRRDRLWMLTLPDGTDPEDPSILPSAFVPSEDPMPKPVRMWPTPVASDGGARQGSVKWLGSDLVTTVADSEYIDGEISRPQAQLNPEFTEWMMGWPIGWTSLDPLDHAQVRDWEAKVRAGTWWSVDPDISKTTKGVANQAMRVKACGNGQAGPCAALAFESLRRSFGEVAHEARLQLAGKSVPKVVEISFDDFLLTDEPYQALDIRLVAKWDSEARIWRDMTLGLYLAEGNLQSAPEYKRSWPRAGLVLDGCIFQRPSILVSRAQQGILGGRRPIDHWDPFDMLPTPVAYDATPGGPGNHYTGMGWLAKQGIIGEFGSPERVAKAIEVQDRRAVAKKNMKPKVKAVIQNPDDSPLDFLDP